MTRSADPLARPSAPLETCPRVTGTGERSVPRATRLRLGVALIVVALIVLPAIVAIVAMAGRRWYPTDDFAIIDLRVRDVWSSHPPLTGLYSRPGWNHPGPLTFWLIGLLSGAAKQASWATRVGGALLQAIALVWLGWVTWRRGMRILLAAATVTALTYLGSGSWLFRQPWNLYIPVPYFVLFVFLTCIVATGSFRQLIAMSIVGTLIFQTHVGYAALVALGFGWAIGWTIVDTRRSGQPPPRWRSTLVISAVIAGVAWLPPIADAVFNSGGNARKLVSYFSGTHAKVGSGRAIGIMAAEFRIPPPWLGGHDRLTPFTQFAIPAADLWLLIPMALLGLGFLAARRTGSDFDTRMIGFAAALLIVGVLAISQADEARAYTFQWRVVVAAFVVVASAWSVAAAVRTSASVAMRLVAVSVVMGVIAWGTLDRAASETSGANMPLEQWDHALRVAMTQLTDRGLPARTPIRLRSYGVTLPSLFDGVVNELDRAGVDVRVDPSRGRIFGSQRVIPLNRRVETWYVTEQGSLVPNLLALPGARVIASTTPLSRSEDAELTSLQEQLRDQLARSPRPGLGNYVDQAILALASGRVPGVDPTLASRVAGLDDRVSQSNACRCAVVAVPAADHESPAPY